MKTNSNYSGIVTLNFYDKNHNLKGTYKNHNMATPYFFYNLTKLLQGQNNSNILPGKLALTTEGGFESEEQEGKVFIKYKTNEGNLLASPLPKITPYTSRDIAKRDIEENISPSTPYLRIEFNLSYYFLKSDIVENGLKTLDECRLWLLSNNETSFGAEIKVPNNTGGSSGLQEFMENITYDSIEEFPDIPEIYAQIQIGKDEGYSLQEGEYISVLWDMYFYNNYNDDSDGGNN